MCIWSGLLYVLYRTDTFYHESLNPESEMSRTDSAYSVTSAKRETRHCGTVRGINTTFIKSIVNVYRYLYCLSPIPDNRSRLTKCDRIWCPPGLMDAVSPDILVWDKLFPDILVWDKLPQDILVLDKLSQDILVLDKLSLDNLVCDILCPDF